MSYSFLEQAEEMFRDEWLIVVWKILARTGSYFKVCQKFVVVFLIGVVNLAYFFDFLFYFFQFLIEG